VGGSIAGLIAPGLVLTDGSASVTPATNATTFEFPALATGAAYDVTIQAQPSGLKCTVSKGTGTVAAVNITSVHITCPSGWVWVAGSDTTNATVRYGTMGVAAAGNTPGARSGAASWTDGNGNLWLFGGQYNSANLYNDLWEFSPATGLWTWVSGPNTVNGSGSYGTQGVAAIGNVPGAREGSAPWIDTAGHLWLFGGRGCDSLGSNWELGDLWEFSSSSGLWTWVQGVATVTSLGSYGEKGVAATGNIPPARDSSLSWRDSSGDFWLFGGVGENAAEETGGYFNDLWKFSPQTGLWTWMSGSNSSYTNMDDDPGGVYGTKGVAATGNIPAARFGAAGWIDGAGNFWVFGVNTPAF